MGIVVITAISRTDGSDAETLGEVLLGVYAMVFRFVLLGILAWSTLMVVMIRPPRRTWRVAVFVGGTPISQLVAAVVIPHEAVGPWPVRIVALLVPAALGYWAAAAAPPPTTEDERQQRHSTAVAG